MFALGSCSGKELCLENVCAAEDFSAWATLLACQSSLSSSLISIFLSFCFLFFFFFFFFFLLLSTRERERDKNYWGCQQRAVLGQYVLTQLRVLPLLILCDIHSLPSSWAPGSGGGDDGKRLSLERLFAAITCRKSPYTDQKHQNYATATSY